MTIPAKKLPSPLRDALTAGATYYLMLDETTTPPRPMIGFDFSWVDDAPDRLLDALYHTLHNGELGGLQLQRRNEYAPDLSPFTIRCKGGPALALYKTLTEHYSEKDTTKEIDKAYIPELLADLAEGQKAKATDAKHAEKVTAHRRTIAKSSAPIIKQKLVTTAEPAIRLSDFLQSLSEIVEKNIAENIYSAAEAVEIATQFQAEMKILAKEPYYALEKTPNTLSEDDYHTLCRSAPQEVNAELGKILARMLKTKVPETIGLNVTPVQTRYDIYLPAPPGVDISRTKWTKRPEALKNIIGIFCQEAKPFGTHLYVDVGEKNSLSSLLQHYAEQSQSATPQR